MGKISTYEQGQLASQVVGTPGVDNSTAQLFNTVAASASSIADSAFQSLQTDRVEELRKQREQEQLAKAHQKMLDEVDTAAHRGRVDLLLDEDQNAVKADKQNDPSGAPILFNDKANKRLDEYLSTISDENVRMKVKEESLKEINSRANSLNNWVYTQRTANAQGNIANVFSDYATSAGNLTSAKDVGEYWQKIEAMRGATTAAFGADGDKLIRETKTGITKQYIEGMMLRSPDGVEPTLKSGAFDSVLNAHDKEELLYRSRTLVKAKEHEVQNEQKAQEVEVRSGLAKRSLEVDNKSPQSLADYHDFLLKQSKLPHSLEAMNDIRSQIRQVESDMKSQQKGSDKETKDSWESKYNSLTAAKVRAQLSALRVQYGREIKETKDPKKAWGLVTDFQNKMNAAKNSGYLDHYGKSDTFAIHNQWVDSQSALIRNKPKNIFTQAQEFFDHTDHNAREFYYKNTPDPKVADQLSTQHQQMLDQMIKRYQKKLNKTPSKAVIEKMSRDIMSSQGGTVGR